jgi:uncharacterized protein YbaP (TraB family)
MPKVKRLALAGAVCAAWLAAAAPALADPAVWVVRDADSTIVLFGSVHSLPKTVKWRSKRLDQALASADDLWFEIPLDAYSAADAAAEAGRRAMLPPGQTLSALLDPPSRARLVRLAKTLAIPMADLEQLRPWMAEVRLSVTALERRFHADGDGVEEQIDLTTPRTVVRRAFETPVQQIDILAGDDLSTQLASLKETLRELDRDPNAFRRLLKAWLAGDAKALAREVIEPMRKVTPRTYRSLVVERNRAWTEQIARRLAGSGHTVMVVGAGHLVGPDSVPAMLRARGIAVGGP